MYHCFDGGNLGGECANKLSVEDCMFHRGLNIDQKRRSRHILNEFRYLRYNGTLLMWICIQKVIFKIQESCTWLHHIYFCTRVAILAARSTLNSGSLIFRYSRSSFVKAFTLPSLTRLNTSSNARLLIETSESCKFQHSSHTSQVFLYMSFKGPKLDIK